MAVIGGSRSDLSITRKTDGNFGNVSASACFPKSRINENGGKIDGIQEPVTKSGIKILVKALNINP